MSEHWGNLWVTYWQVEETPCHMAYVWNCDVTGFHTAEVRLSGKPTLSGLACNSAKSIVSVIRHLGAELFCGISFVEKNMKLARKLLFRWGGCVFLKGWCSEQGCWETTNGDLQCAAAKGAWTSLESCLVVVGWEDQFCVSFFYSRLSGVLVSASLWEFFYQSKANLFVFFFN